MDPRGRRRGGNHGGYGSTPLKISFFKNIYNNYVTYIFNVFEMLNHNLDIPKVFFNLRNF